MAILAFFEMKLQILTGKRKFQHTDQVKKRVFQVKLLLALERCFNSVAPRKMLAKRDFFSDQHSEILSLTLCDSLSCLHRPVHRLLALKRIAGKSSCSPALSDAGT